MVKTSETSPYQKAVMMEEQVLAYIKKVIPPGLVDVSILDKSIIIRPAQIKGKWVYFVNTENANKPITLIDWMKGSFYSQERPREDFKMADEFNAFVVHFLQKMYPGLDIRPDTIYNS